MRIGELSRTTHVPISTIKYYIREGLLPAGTATATNQADYDNSHVERVRLIRALVEVGGLRTGDVAAVIEAVANPDVPPLEALCVSQDALVRSPDGHGAGSGLAAALVDELIERHGFVLRPDAPVRSALAAAAERMAEFGLIDPDDPDPAIVKYLDRVAEMCRELAVMEMAMLPGETTTSELVANTVVGTMLADAVVGAIRRIAHEDLATRATAQLPYSANPRDP